MAEADNRPGSYFLSKAAMKECYEDYMAPGQKDKKVRDFFVLINRKGYWDYKILFPQGYPEIKNMVVISDRFLDKCPMKRLRELLEDKRVIIYDDSLTNGANMFYYYLLCRKAGAKRVEPVVYGLHSDFPTENASKLLNRECLRFKGDEFKKDNKQLIEEFTGALKCRLLLGSADIDRLSVWQTQFFQTHVSPLVMDLPIINRIRGSEVHQAITLSEEQFKALCSSGNGKWEFVENEMKGWGEPVTASYFSYHDKVWEETLAPLLHEAVVKCKYHRREGMIDVVFTPFTIVGSVTYEELLRLFTALYEGTEYEKYLAESCEGAAITVNAMEQDEHLCNAMYRAVIFRLSDYVGKHFADYFAETLGLETEYDWNNMKDHFPEEFIRTQRAFGRTYDKALFFKQALGFPECKQAPPVMEKGCDGQMRERATQERINNFIRERVTEKKSDSSLSLSARVYTLETMKRELDKRFEFACEEERDRMLTKTILLFLESNSFSNYIMVQPEEHRIYRSFRYGENSEVLLHENLWFFYAFLHAYYVNFKEELQQKYRWFLERMKSYIEEKNYMDIMISRDGFSFLGRYFGRLAENGSLAGDIRRRKYLLDCGEYSIPAFSKEERDIRSNIVREAAYAVKRWGEA